MKKHKVKLFKITLSSHHCDLDSNELEGHLDKATQWDLVDDKGLEALEWMINKERKNNNYYNRESYHTLIQEKDLDAEYLRQTIADYVAHAEKEKAAADAKEKKAKELRKKKAEKKAQTEAAKKKKIFEELKKEFSNEEV